MSDLMTDEAWAEKRLFGTRDAEELYPSIDDALEVMAYDMERASLHVDIVEHEVLPRGQFGGDALPSAAWLAERTVECGTEDAGFAEIYDEYLSAAKQPEVIAAFDAALKALAAHQRFQVAGDEVRTHALIVHFDGGGGYDDWDHR